MRLDKFLTECGLGSRSEMKQNIRKKLVLVNGIPAANGDMKINEKEDLITFCGKRVVYEKFSYYLLHKPAGCVTATEDHHHKTVMEYLPQPYPKGLSPVGRLDIDTEGLLLITNDGQLNHNLLSPSHHVPKTYYAILDAPVPALAVELFAEGIDIGDDKPTLPAELEILPATDTLYHAKLTLHEGRFHQVKRMFEKVGCTVTYLKRLTMGPLSLGELAVGECRKLTEEEIKNLYE